MPVVDVLAMAIAPAIAKGLLKVWLKDIPLGAEVATCLLDLIQTRVKDQRQSRKLERLVSEIGQGIADQIQPYLDYSSLPEGSQLAVLHVLESSLSKASIDLDTAVTKDLDAELLAQHIKSFFPSGLSQLSFDEIELLDRLTFASSASIVAIAGGLPKFNASGIGEILKRTTDLLESSQEILEELARVRDAVASLHSGKDESFFEQRYRVMLSSLLDRVQLFGVETSRTSREYSLNISYVNLTLASQEGESDEVVRPDDEMEEIEGPHDLAVSALAKRLHRSNRILILGDAGSGKTTLLKWLAIKAATHGLPEALEGIDGMVPFYIPLRKCVDFGFPSPEDFLRLVLPSIAGKAPSGWVHQELESGALVLIDGVDEVPKSLRNKSRSWINELLLAFPSSAFIVSSRPSAVDSKWTDSFDCSTLMPMELPEIYQFLSNWHAAVANQLSEEEDKELVERLEANLRGLLAKNRPLRKLATNPLLCAVTCALHRQKLSHLPTDRIMLYEACCQMLLDRRDLEQDLTMEKLEFPPITFRQKMHILEELAFWMLRNGKSVIKASIFDEFLIRILNNMDISFEKDGEGIRRYFLERSAIIREPEVGSVDFAHRTFQEYLAAKAIASSGDFGLLVANAHDDHWRETVILCAGQSGRASVEIISLLLQRSEKEPKRKHYLQLLAVACLDGALQKPPEIRDSLSSGLRSLLPPKSLTEAKIVGSAGELALPYLAYNSKLKVQEAVACVRALGLIGGETALEHLARFALDRRPKVHRELFRALPAFDSSDYYSSVLRHLDPVNLDIDAGYAELRILKIYPNLRSLAVRLNSEVNDLTSFEDLPNLNQLKIIGGTFRSFAPLAALNVLEDLRVDCSLVDDISCLEAFANLRVLWLDNAGLIEDYSPIQSTQLRSVTLDCNGRDFDFSILSDLPLKVVSIHNAGCLSNLESIVTLESLTHLHLHSKVIANEEELSAIAGAYRLNSLSISWFKNVENINARLMGSGIRYLSISGLPRLGNLAFLKGTHLERLALWGVALEDLSEIADVASLKKISLIGCQRVSDVRWLRQISGLEEVHVSGCPRVRSLGAVDQIPTLKEVFAPGIAIT